MCAHVLRGAEQSSPKRRECVRASVEPKSWCGTSAADSGTGILIPAFAGLMAAMGG